MPSLEETIREIAARGDMSHISLVPSQKGNLWRASFTPCSVFGISFAEDADPVKALQLAMTSTKLKSRRVFVKDQDLVGTIHQDTVEVEQPDEYLAGIQAKTAAQTDDDGLPDPTA